LAIGSGSFFPVADWRAGKSTVNTAPPSG
jgi:hypothetical protein